MLRRTRGTPDVELEFEDIYQASQAVRNTFPLLLGIAGPLPFVCRRRKPPRRSPSTAC